jgi:Rrf2 family nitric oxide-sensitive transcriptional repressor
VFTAETGEATMQLSRFTDYAVRVMIYATLHQERLVTLSEIAGFYDISFEHLRKVVHQLATKGYLSTFRGKNGGVRLARDASEINIGKLVADMEGNEPLIDCTGLGCKVLPVCALPPVLRKAQQAFYDELGQYSLADMIRHRNTTTQQGDDTLIATLP